VARITNMRNNVPKNSTIYLFIYIILLKKVYNFKKVIYFFYIYNYIDFYIPVQGLTLGKYLTPEVLIKN
jgi:hypothetical protein